MIFLKQIQIVELCCGLGGWSRGFYEIAPHNVVCHGIDVMDHGYPFRFIEADLYDWEPSSNFKVDVVIASPPYRDFSKALFFASRILILNAFVSPFGFTLTASRLK